MTKRWTIVAVLSVLALQAGAVWSQAGYPAKPVRWIVPWPPGGGADTLTRLLSPKLSEGLGQQIIVDNRGGAAGNIGAEMAAKSPPDGYTIAFAYSGTHSINPSIYSRMPFKESDFAPIIWLSAVPQVVVVHPSLPVRNIKELIALAKAHPGQLTYGSSGSGAINHLTGELFNSMTGTKLVHVPYKGGGPAAIALLSGEITFIFGEPASVAQYVKAGRLRAIAVTSGRRSLFLPDLPTIAESGVPGYEVTSWNGVLAPAGVSPEIVKRLNGDLNRIIAAPDMKKRMIELGFEPVGGPPEKFGEFIHAEILKWAPVVKKAGVKVD
jgi:tripartite-type tricarboxylate transporter receptor subunit TctC